MFRCFYPEKYLDSTYDIDFKKEYENGIRGVIFDVDNTLVPHGAAADEQSRQLFLELKQLGMKTLLLSNNKEPRVKSFAEEVGSIYIFKAKKPSPVNYKAAMERMGTGQKSTLFVGDQLFTDVWGANRAGVKAYLVRPIHPKEEIQIVLKRYLEKIVLFFYKRQIKRVENKNEQ